MISNITKLLFCSGILFLIASCDKEKDPIAFLSAKVDGKSFTASYVFAVYSNSYDLTRVGGYGSEGNEEMVITVTGGGKSSFNIDSINVGSFSNSQSFITSYGLDVPYGKLILTKFDLQDSLISGNFYFNGIDLQGNTHEITEGIFENIPLHQE